jgi:hypothetical protein
LPDCSFDVILETQTLEHVPRLSTWRNARGCCVRAGR